MCSYCVGGTICKYVHMYVRVMELSMPMCDRVCFVGGISVWLISRCIFNRWTEFEQQCPSKCQVGQCVIKVEVDSERAVPQFMLAAGLHSVSV